MASLCMISSPSRERARAGGLAQIQIIAERCNSITRAAIRVILLVGVATHSDNKIRYSWIKNRNKLNRGIPRIPLSQRIKEVI